MQTIFAVLKYEYSPVQRKLIGLDHKFQHFGYWTVENWVQEIETVHRKAGK
jgi:hypothetical protein